MKNTIIPIIFIILLTSFTSARIIIAQQPNEMYSSGDTINLPVKIITATDLNGFFQMEINCNGKETEIHKEFVLLAGGDEKQVNLNIPLIKSFVGESTGVCKIKSSLNEEYVLTNEFTILNKINIELKLQQTEASPEQEIIVQGEAIRESGELVEGIIEIKIAEGESEIVNILDTVKNGYFFVNFSLPKETKAGQYLIQININEQDVAGDETNKGFVDYNLLITQIPTSLEIIYENEEIEPGTNIKIKTILFDQTGERIESNSKITVKDNLGIMRIQEEKPTDEFLEIPTLYNEPPAEWKITASSNEIISESNLLIKENAKVETIIINKTLTIINIGNIPYNDTIFVKIENKTIGINVSLQVEASQNYLLSAPEGQYEVKVTSDGETVSEEVMLTGKSIDVRKAKEGIITVIKHPISWIFILIVLGFMIFIIIKKGYKKSFIGQIHIPSFKKKEKTIELKKNLITSNKAEISLSIKGQEQDSSVVCFKIKNLKELSKNITEERTQKINTIAENKKAVLYENQENLFFILAPLKTKTFSNEKIALELAQEIKEEIEQYNKMAKEKIEFGISLNYGKIIAKQEDTLKFMSRGTFTTTAKKIALISEKEILLSEKINEKLIKEVKTEKHQYQNLTYYKIKEIKNPKETTKFIENFLKRIKE